MLFQEIKTNKQQKNKNQNPSQIGKPHFSSFYKKGKGNNNKIIIEKKVTWDS